MPDRVDLGAPRVRADPVEEAGLPSTDSRGQKLPESTLSMRNTGNESIDSWREAFSLLIERTSYDCDPATLEEATIIGRLSSHFCPSPRLAAEPKQIDIVSFYFSCASAEINKGLNRRRHALRAPFKAAKTLLRETCISPTPRHISRCL